MSRAHAVRARSGRRVAARRREEVDVEPNDNDWYEKQKAANDLLKDAVRPKMTPEFMDTFAEVIRAHLVDASDAYEVLTMLEYVWRTADLPIPEDLDAYA